MKVKELIEYLQDKNPEARVRIDFCVTNYHTHIVPNNKSYTGNGKITPVNDPKNNMIYLCSGN